MDNSILFLQRKLAIRFLLDVKRLSTRDLSLNIFFNRRRKKLFNKNVLHELLEDLVYLRNIDYSHVFRKTILHSNLFNDYDRDVSLLSLDFFYENNSLPRLDDYRNRLSYRHLYDFVMKLESRYLRTSKRLNASILRLRKPRLFRWVKLLFFWLIVMYNDLFLISFKSMLLFWFQYLELYNKFSSFLRKQNKYVSFFGYDYSACSVSFKVFVSSYSLNMSKIFFLSESIIFKLRNFFVYFYSISRKKPRIYIYKNLFFRRNTKYWGKFRYGMNRRVFIYSRLPKFSRI